MFGDKANVSPYAARTDAEMQDDYCIDPDFYFRHLFPVRKAAKSQRNHVDMPVHSPPNMTGISNPEN